MNNNASNNNYGIYLFNSANNLIYNNYFDNTNNAYDNDYNIWNIAKTAGTNIIGGPYLGGNYWSDYAETDMEEDGLGDMPYNIAGGSNKDYLPLVPGGVVPPTITSYAPPSSVANTICNWRTFNVTVNQTANVSWYLNDSLLFTNVSVREANCTLHAEVTGEHNVSAVASNENGTDMQTWVWNVEDITPPVITISNVMDGGIYNHDIIPSISVTDNYCPSPTVVCLLNGQAYTPGTLITIERSHTLTVTATDAAGNQNTTTVSFILDKTPPQITNPRPADLSYTNNPSLTITATINELSGANASCVTVLINAADLTAGCVITSTSVSYTPDNPMSEGRVNVSIIASDMAGNIMPLPYNWSFTIDLTPPVIILSNVTDGETYNHDITPSISVTDNYDASPTVTCLLNGQSYTPGTEITIERNHTLTVTATDAAGNRNSTTVSFILDKTPPQVTDPQPISYSNNSHPTITATINDISGANTSTVTVRINDADVTSGCAITNTSVSYTPAEAFSEGTIVNVSIKASDLAGNIMPQPYNWSFTIDLTPPVIIISNVTDGGIYSHNITPCISVTDNYDTIPTVDYLLNGEPYTPGTLITSEMSHTLTVTATDIAGSQNSVSIGFILDKSSPHITNPQPISYSNNSRPTITATLYDINGVNTSTVIVLVNDADVTSGCAITGTSVSYTPDEAFSEGTIVNVSIMASDMAGHIMPQPYNWSFTIDLTPPILTISNITDGAIYVWNVIPGISATDNYDPTPTVTCLLNGEPYTPGTAIRAEKRHTLTVTAMDAAGNQNTKTISFILDKSPPRITSQQPISYSSNPRPAITATIDDLIGTNTSAVTVLINDVDVTASCVITSTNVGYTPDTPLSEGIVKVSIMASDMAGNTMSQPYNWYFTVDLSPPIILISDVTDGGIYNHDIIPGISAADNYDSSPTVTCLLNEESYTQGTVITTERSHALTVTTTDAAGNRNTKTISFTLDKTPPQVTDTQPADLSYTNNPSPTITATIDDLSGANTSAVTVLINGVDVTSGCAITSTSVSYTPDEPFLEDTVVTAIIMASDLAGNTMSQPYIWSFTIDLSPPAITISNVTNGVIYLHDVTPIISVTDNYDPSPTVACLLNGESYTPGTVITTERSHTLTVTATDTAGNRNITTASFILDKSPPQITNPQPTSYSSNPRPAITATINDVSGANTSTVTVLINDADVTSGCAITSTSVSYTPDTSFSECAIVNISIMASDMAGHSMPQPYNWSFTTDFTLPSISNVLVTSITGHSATITWDTDEESNSVVNYGLTDSLGLISSSQSFVTSHSVSLSSLDDGRTYHFSVSSTDRAGNTRTSSKSVFSTPDITPPTISNVASSPDVTTATISWDTDESSSSVVNYGTSPSLGQSKSGDAATSEHLITLAGLGRVTKYYYTVESTDSSGNKKSTGQHTFRTTNNQPIITYLTPAKWVVDKGETITITARATDVDGDGVSYSWSASGGSISGSGNSAQWTAPSNKGSFSIGCTVTDTFGASQTSYIFISVENHPPTITLHPSSTSANPGDVITISANANDVDGDPLTITWGKDGGSISGSGEQVTWTAPSTKGSYNVWATANDGWGGIASYTVTINVGNRPPVIQKIWAQPASIALGETATVTVLASDPNDDELTYEWSPSYAITGSGSSVEFTARSKTDNTVTVVVTDDSQGQTSASTTINIDNSPPTIGSLTANPVQIELGEYSQISVVASDPDGDELDFIWQCEGGSYTGSGESISWTAEVDGTYDVTVVVDDRNGGRVERSTTITVGENRRPIISGITATPPRVEPNQISHITVGASDLDGDELEYRWTSEGGVISGDRDSVTWTAPDLIGKYTIAVTVTDVHGETASSWVSINVGNSDPVISNISADPPSPDVGETTTISVAAEDPDEDTLTYTWSTTDRGELIGSGETATWTPQDEGDTEIEVFISDGEGGWAERSIIISVGNHKPIVRSLTAYPLKVKPGGTCTITAGASDPDGDDITYQWSSIMGVQSGDDSSIQWNAPDSTGHYAITLTVSDPYQSSEPEQIWIEVFQPTTLSITTPDPDTTTHASTIIVTGTASNPLGIASVTVNGALASGAADWSTWSAEVALAVGENTITVIAKDMENNKKVVTLQVFYHVNEDVYLLFSNPNQVEVGGTFYRWYKTIPYSTISIDSNYLDYSQPDENGVFNVSLNTQKYGITSPGDVDVLTYSASITRNGQTIHIDPSPLSFTLNVLPRNYSTSWYMGSTIGGGGGIIAYAEGERNVDFAMTTGNQDSILLMNRDKADKGTVGATAALFEAKAAVVKVDAASIDTHISVQSMCGSHVNVDYENANDVQKLEGALYILTSTISSVNPLTYETIDVISSRLTGDLTTDYYESGIGVSGGSSANLVKFGFGIGGETKGATIGSLKIGSESERGASFKSRTYPATDFHEYLAQYVYSAEHGLHGSVLGNDIVPGGPSEYIDYTVILGQDSNNVLYGKAKIKDSEKQVESDHVTRELTYDYGPISDDRIINPFETDDIPVSDVLDKFMNAIEDYFSQGNITVVETRGQRLAIELPLSLTIAGVKVSINPGVRMGDANNYLTDKKVMYNKEPYTLEKYTYDTNVQDSAEELTYIVESLLEPVGAAMEDVMKTIEAITEKGKEIVFSTGKIIFDSTTHFFTVDDSYSSTYSTTSSRFTQSDDQSPEITISTYTPDEPAPQTMATFGAMGISSSYVTSLSGGDFVIGNITDLQPYNISFTPAAQLTLNYTEEDVAGIDESNISIYRWDDANNSWMPFFSIVNTTENIVTTNITRFGTYAIGCDITNPVIEWNASDLYQGNITVEAIIADTGSGINISSIKLYIDGDEQNFTYNIFSGLLKSTINASVSDHTVRIYAEDTSGNGNVTEKVVTSIEPASVTCLQINRTGNDTIELSWTGENGTYSIQNYLIYRNVELVINTTQTNFTTESIGSATYTVYPVDVNGNIGTGKAMTYRLSQLIPEFTYNWENTLYPTAGCPIIFDATGSHLINGTIETNITTYIWIFDGDVNNTESGRIINYTFANAGMHKITLQIEDGFQNNAMITEIMDISPLSHSITSFTPLSPVNDTEGASRTFNITIDQSVNVSWQINGTEVQTNVSVRGAFYTNTSAAVGVWNVSAIASNANGTDMHTWTWNVTKYVDTTNFTVTLNSPPNQTITNDNTPDFNFIVSGSESYYSCELFINDTGYGRSTWEQDAEDTYNCEGTFYWGYPCFGAVDESWDTRAHCLSPGYDGSCNYCNILENYTVPVGVNSARWTFKQQSFELTPFVLSYWNYSSAEWQEIGSYTSISTSEVELSNDAFTFSPLRLRSGVRTCMGGSSGYYEGKVTWIGVTQNNTPTVITANHTISDRTYNWYVNCTAGGVTTQSEIREITIDATPTATPPTIISHSPPSPVTDTVGHWRTFNVTVNQTANVSWYLDESFLFTNESVTEANCMLHAEVAGMHNVSAVASNENGTDMQTWAWNVQDITPPTVEMISPKEGWVNASICVRLNFTAEGPSGIDWIGYSLDGGDNVTIAGNVTIGCLGAGSHNVTVYVNDTAGNENSSDTVSFTLHPCDIDSDSHVYLSDLMELADAFDSHPGDPDWNPCADLDCDGHIYLSDLMILADNFDEHY